MPPDTAPIIAAARHRRELTRSKAVQALREMDRTGAPVTFESVAKAAGVSRSWLYAQDDIRTEIERLREATGRAPSPAIPASQRASNASLSARLEAAQNRNRQLNEENQRLRRQLAAALGDQRAAAPQAEADPTPRPSAKRHSTTTIGPRH